MHLLTVHILDIFSQQTLQIVDHRQICRYRRTSINRPNGGKRFPDNRKTQKPEKMPVKLKIRENSSINIIY